MTHNEKEYLARKINQVVEKLIEERIEGLDGRQKRRTNKNKNSDGRRYI